MLNLSTTQASTLLRIGISHRLLCQTWNRCILSERYHFRNLVVSRLGGGNRGTIPYSAAGTVANSLPVVVSRLTERHSRNMSVNKSLSPENHPERTSTAAQEEPAKKVDEILWDEERQRFKTPDGKAYLQYVIKPINHCSTTKHLDDEDEKQVMLMQHTYVPSVFRGQGVAARLCIAAFQHCKNKGLLVLPVCTYVSDTFLPRNPEWEDLVLKDSNAKSGL